MTINYNNLEEEALAYHEKAPRGKIEIRTTKPLETKQDLSMAYTPGVGAVSRKIAQDPLLASSYTARGNLIAVVTNGTAVLGLGSIGPLAAKPVMEGKGALFKKFAGIDVFDLEINETDVNKFCQIVAALEPTFGAINLEDIKAPECFEIEKILKQKMNIPVFHDDQHGTAITVAAAVYNALDIIDKRLSDLKIVCSGAGAAALACLDMLVLMGAQKENIIVCDLDGVLNTQRTTGLDKYKIRYLSSTSARTLQEAINGADMFLGCSAPNVLCKEDVKKMAKNPLIFALANPTPEIMPEDVWAVREDAICATGRSDYPNQINNVLCFPFIFRGALDVGATTINEEMKLSCVQAIAKLARLEIPQLVTDAYGDMPQFGREYILPKPFDPRLVSHVALAVAKAAMETGVATRPILDFDAYVNYLERLSDRSSGVMKHIMDSAIKAPKRVVYCDGEDPRVLRAVQIVVDSKIAYPILIGRRSVVITRITKNRLRLQEGRDFELCDPQDDSRYKEYWSLYHDIMRRQGGSPDNAKIIVRTDVSSIGALMLRRGEADAMLCGVTVSYQLAKTHVTQIIGMKDNKLFSTVMCVISSEGPIFIADTHGIYNPTAEEIADITISAKHLVRRFGLEPRVALLSHSNFGSSELESAKKMARAFRILEERGESYQVEGEMHGRLALNEFLRKEIFPSNGLSGNANLLIMPNMDSAHICVSLLSHLCGGISIGPISLHSKQPTHILTRTATVRDIVNMTAISVVDVQKYYDN